MSVAGRWVTQVLCLGRGWVSQVPCTEGRGYSRSHVWEGRGLVSYHVTFPRMHVMYLPHPLVTDEHLWKHYLPQTSFAGGNYIRKKFKPLLPHILIDVNAIFWWKTVEPASGSILYFANTSVFNVQRGKDDTRHSDYLTNKLLPQAISVIGLLDLSAFETETCRCGFHLNVSNWSVWCQSHLYNHELCVVVVNIIIVCEQISWLQC